MTPQERRDLVRHMLRELETPAQELSEWETDFVGSVTDQFKQRGTLSEKQFTVLQRIYSEKGA